MSIGSTGYVAGVSPQEQRNSELKKACQDFESVFTYELLKSMRKTIDKCELFHGGQGEEIYESLLDQELSKSVSGYGSNSLSELLYQQLSRIDSSSEAGEGEEVIKDFSSAAGRTTGYGKSPSPAVVDEALYRKTESGSVISSVEDTQKATGSDAVPEAESEPAWPLKSVISSRYGFRKDPFTSENRFHSGIDIAAEKGTEVKAAMSGKVIMSCKTEDYGNVVAVDHGQGVVTIYAHNEKNLVKVGEEVEKGSLIAKVGSTGRSTGPHLHFEVRKNGAKVNPIEFLGVA
jgi:murein DD-endopeptidase MepM/ murein hydrolase activator NlpD